MSNEGVLEALASLPTFHHPTASPDGSTVTLYYNETGRNELYLLDVSGELNRVSTGEVPRNARWHVEWSADGDFVYFHLDEAGDEQNDIHSIDSSGAVEPIVEMDGQLSLADVSEDRLLFGSTADGQLNLYDHDLSSGETRKVTDYERAVWGGVLSPDGERIAYATNETDVFENMDAYVANADGSEPRNLEIGETGAEATVSDWRSEKLLVSDNSEDLSRVGVYDLASETVTWFGDLVFEESAVQFLPDGRILALRTRRAAVIPVVYDPTSGEGREFDLPEGVATVPQQGEAALSEDRVLVTQTTADNRSELLAYDIETDTYETLLEAEYGEFGPNQFIDAEYFTFDSHDGLEIEALLYDSGERPSPLIVNPHGGPRSADHRAFSERTQFLIARGYSVLQVNYRGSTGRGREFVELLYDDWGGDEQADIAAGVRHVLETREWLDEKQVVVFGGSYGGYSAFCQLLQYPDLYAAGIAWIGVTDLEDMYENTMPHFRSELIEKYLGTPEENPELYTERSPVNHVENLDAPLLIGHGVNDRRVPISQARLFKEALDEVGFEEEIHYEYVELGEEGHGSSDVDQKIRLYRLLGEFLDRRLEPAE